MKVFAVGAVAIALAMVTPAALADVSAPVAILDELEDLGDDLENIDDKIEDLEDSDLEDSDLEDLKERDLEDLKEDELEESALEDESDRTERTGSFEGVDVGHQVSGTVEVYERDGETYIEIGEDFETTPGPDLVVILYAESEVPRAIDEEDYVTIAELNEFPIGEEIAIDDDIDASEYDSVAIWCRAFNFTFGFASLE